MSGSVVGDGRRDPLSDPLPDGKSRPEEVEGSLWVIAIAAGLCGVTLVVTLVLLLVRPSVGFGATLVEPAGLRAAPRLSVADQRAGFPAGDTLAHYALVGRWRRTYASWFTGARGACGHRLRGLYVAHKTWRCGTLVEVCRHHRCVVVRVQDRGPYVAGRALDLSRAAADQIGLTSLGVARVRYRRVG